MDERRREGKMGEGMRRGGRWRREGKMGGEMRRRDGMIGGEMRRRRWKEERGQDGR